MDTYKNYRSASIDAMLMTRRPLTRHTITATKYSTEYNCCSCLTPCLALLLIYRLQQKCELTTQSNNRGRAGYGSEDAIVIDWRVSQTPKGTEIGTRRGGRPEKSWTSENASLFQRQNVYYPHTADLRNGVCSHHAHKKRRGKTLRANRLFRPKHICRPHYLVELLLGHIFECHGGLLQGRTFLVGFLRDLLPTKKQESRAVQDRLL